MRLLAVLAAGLALAGAVAANEPYAQSALYIAGYDCCTFSLTDGDTSARFLLADALSPLGLAPAAHVNFHGPNHNPLQGSIDFCGASPRTGLVPGLDHVHLYLLAPPDHLTLCGASAGPGATVGTAEVHLNDA